MAELGDLKARLCTEYDASGMKAAQADIARMADMMEMMVAGQKKAGTASEDAKKKLGLFSDGFKQINVLGGAASISVNKASLALAGMGVAAGAALKSAISAGNEFNKVMAQVATLNTEVAAKIDVYAEGILKLARAMGQDATVAANAMYDAISSGIPPDNVLTFMEAAGKAAVAGASDISTSVSGLAVAVNSYNMNASDAMAVSDVMFQTVNYGVVTYDELASSMGKVTGIAYNMGVPFAELNAAIATVTTKGFAGAEAVTAVRSSLVALSKGTPALAQAFSDLGYANGQAMLDTLGYGKTLQTLSDYAENAGMSVTQLFGRVEATNAVLSLTGENGKVAADILDKISNSAGATERAFAIMEETGSQKAAKLTASLDQAKIGIGTQAEVLSGPFRDALQGVIDRFNATNEAGQTLAAGTLILASGFGTVGGAGLQAGAQIGQMSVALKNANISMSSITAAAKGLAGGLGAIGVVAAVAYGVRVAVQQWDEAMRKAVESTGDAGASLSTFTEIAAKTKAEATGLGGVVANLKFAGNLNRDVLLGTDAFLQFGLALDKTVLQSSSFQKGLKSLQIDLGTGKITTDEYEAGLVALADAESRAAGKGAVLSEAQQQVASAFLKRVDAMTSGDKALSDVLAGDKKYASMQETVSAAVAQGALTQDEGTAALRGYVDQVHEAISGNEDMAAQLGVMATQQRAYSDEIVAASGGTLGTYDPNDERFGDDEEARQKHFDEVGKIHADALNSYFEWGANWYQMEQDHAADMEKARAEDAASAAAAAAEAAKQRDKAAAGVAEHGYKLQKLGEDIAKANEKGDAGKAAKLQEDIANEQERWSQLTAVTVAGASNKAAEVEAAYQAERQAQLTHLGQMALDQLNALMAAGEIAPEQADRIYGSIAAAFPGAELFSPMNQAVYQFNQDLGQAFTGGVEEAARLNQTMVELPATLDASAAASADLKQRVIADMQEQASAAGLAFTVRADAEGGFVEVAQASAEQVAAANATLAESTRAMTDVELSAIQEGVAARENSATAAEDTGVRRQAVSDSMVTMSDEELSAVVDAHNGIRTEYTSTGATSSTVTGQVTLDMSTVGESAMGMGDSVTAGTATVQGALGGLGGAGKSAADDIAAGADTAAKSWEDASTRIVGSRNSIAQTGDEMFTQLTTVQTATATQGDVADTASQTEVEAHQKAGEAATAHANEVEDSLKRVEKAMGKGTAKVDTYADAIKRIPRTATTSFALSNYDEMYAKVYALLSMISQATGTFTLNIEGRYKPKDIAAAEGSPRFMLSHWVDELRDNAEQGFEIPGSYNGPDLLLMDDQMAWLVDTAEDLNRALRDLTSGELRDAWSDAAARVAEFEEQMEAAGGATAELTDEVTRWFSSFKEGASYGDMIKEWTRFAGEAFGHKAAAALDEIRDKMSAALAAGDMEEYLYQWERFYERAKQLEQERYEQEIANLEDAKKHLEDMGDKAHADAVQADIDNKKARHEDFMRDLDHENEKVERLVEAYEHYNDKLDEHKDAMEDARQAYQDALEAMQERFEDYEDELSDQVLAALDAQQEALQDELDIELDAWDLRKDAAAEYHDERMTAIEAEEKAVKAGLDVQKEVIDTWKQELEDLENLAWTSGPFAGQTLEDLKTQAEGAADALDKLDEAIDKLPKYDEGKKGPKKKKETGIERYAVTDATLLDALRAAVGSGSITDARLLGFAQILLSGGKLRADYIREVFELVQKAAKAAADSSPLAMEIAAREKIIEQRKAELEKAESAYAWDKMAADKVLEGIAARKTAEMDRYNAEMANIESQRAAAESYYKMQLQGIEDAKDAEKARHEQQLRDIAAAFALELLTTQYMEGGVDRETAARKARDEIDQMMIDAMAIASEAVTTTTAARAQGEAKARRDAHNREVLTRRRAAGIGAAGSGALFVPPGGIGGTSGTKGATSLGPRLGSKTDPVVAAIKGVEAAVSTGLGSTGAVAVRLDAGLDAQTKTYIATRDVAENTKKVIPHKDPNAKRLWGPGNERYWTGELKNPPTTDLAPTPASMAGMMGMHNPRVPQTVADLLGEAPVEAPMTGLSGLIGGLGPPPPMIPTPVGAQPVSQRASVTLINYGSITLDGDPGSDFEEGLIGMLGVVA